MLKELKILLAEHEIPFKYRNNHIPCFPHIVNLCTQKIISELTNPALIGADDDSESDDEDQATDSEDSADDSDLDDGEEGDNQSNKSRSTCKGAATQAKALEADVISLVCNIVCEFRKSGQHREAFMELIKVDNKKGWFLIDGQATEIQQLQLCMM